jgi:flagellar biosynthetic protein FliQ
MDSNLYTGVAQQGLLVALMVSLPILAVSLFVGLGVSVFQAVTQIQEMTLTFVPKIVGAAIVLMTMGAWMLSTLVRFTHLCFEQAARLGQ